MIADKILQVEGLAGNIVSVINRSKQDTLINQKVINKEALDDNDIKEIPLNVVISYDITMSCTKTANPTQFGVNVNDHIYKEPISMVVAFGVTDFKGTIARLQGLYASVKSGWNSYKAGSSISKSMLDTLINAYESKTLFTINDGLHEYQNMSIDKIEYKRDKSTSRALIATMYLSEWIFVKAENAQQNAAVNPVPLSQTGKEVDESSLS